MAEKELKMLDKEQILSANDLRVEPVETPEWGKGTGVFVRGLTGAERDQFESRGLSTGADGKLVQRLTRNVYSVFACLVICDGSGKRLFTGDDDVSAISKKSSKPLARIWEVGRRLSGMKSGNEEKLVKNSDSGQSGDSGSS